MEPQERGRGEGKEEGKGERRIMAELLTAPWIAKEDFLHQCAGVGTSAGAQQHTPCSYLGGCVGQSGSKITQNTMHRVVKQVCASPQTLSGRKKLLERVTAEKDF